MFWPIIGLSLLGVAVLAFVLWLDAVTRRGEADRPLRLAERLLTSRFGRLPDDLRLEAGERGDCFARYTDPRTGRPTWVHLGYTGVGASFAILREEVMPAEL